MPEQADHTPESGPDAAVEAGDETEASVETAAEESTGEAESAPDSTDEVEPAEPDVALLESRDLALAALREITPESTIGEPADYRLEAGGVVSLRFSNRLPGYPGWFWTVSLARVEGAEPTVLEVELLPGDGALLAPDWVPWAVRLADYHATQAALAEAARAAGEDVESDEDLDDDDLEDVDDLDAVDFDHDGSSILHAGDVDGVDIDELADDDDDDDDSDEDDSDDDEDDSDDDDFEDDGDDSDDSDDDDSDDDDSDDDEDDSDEDDSDD
jgi:hypothetical protein